MRVRVKLFGTLPSYYPGSYPDTGLELDISPATSVAQLVELVQIPQGHIALVVINGTLVKGDALVPDGAEVKFFQPLSGG